MILGVFFKYYYNVYKKITTFEELSKDFPTGYVPILTDCLVTCMLDKVGWRIFEISFHILALEPQFKNGK